jgi:group I intron endonuclease
MKTEIKVGIYAIINKVNNKRYVGQIDNIFSRWEKHKHNFQRGRGAPNLQEDWNEFGENNFELFAPNCHEKDIYSQNVRKYYSKNFRSR